MKRVLCFLMCSLFTLALQAQTGHLKFMGIPLDGTIDQFQAKLIAKGVKVDADLNKLASGEPCRYFRGLFTGRKSIIKIKYNHKTKKVWGAMVVIEYPNKDQANSNLEYFKEKVVSKYKVDKGEDVVKGGIRSHMISIYDSKDFYGFIYLYTLESKKSPEANLVLNYKDYKNTEANEKEDLDDL